VQPNTLGRTATPDIAQRPRRSIRRLSVVNIELKSASTEYSWQIPRNCVSFRLKVRDGTAIRIGTEPGVVGTPSTEKYYTLLANGTLSMGDLEIEDPEARLYFACASGDKFVDILVGLSA